MGASLAEGTFKKHQRCTLEMEKLGISIEDGPYPAEKIISPSMVASNLKFMILDLVEIVLSK